MANKNQPNNTNNADTENSAIASQQAITLVDADGTTISMTPLVTNIDVLAVEKRTRELLELLQLSHGSRFPDNQTRNVMYDKDLEGVAFLIVSPINFRETPDNFTKGKMRTVANAVIQLWNVRTSELSTPRMAQFGGGYVLNQLRGMTEHELVGSYLWTLARDEDVEPYTRGDGYEYPRKLAPWDVTKDTPVNASGSDQTSTWSERVEANAKKLLSK